MGRGRQSLVLPLALPENSGACSLVWSHGFELHVCIETPKAEEAPGEVHGSVTYLRPSLSSSSSRADTPLASKNDACSLVQLTGQPLLREQVPTGAGHTVGVR